MPRIRAVAPPPWRWAPWRPWRLTQSTRPWVPPCRQGTGPMKGQGWRRWTRASAEGGGDPDRPGGACWCCQQWQTWSWCTSPTSPTFFHAIVVVYWYYWCVKPWLGFVKLTKLLSPVSNCFPSLLAHPQPQHFAIEEKQQQITKPLKPSAPLVSRDPPLTSSRPPRPRWVSSASAVPPPATRRAHPGHPHPPG